MSTSKAGLGRPVKLVYYDDQSNSATVSARYQKLLDVDKVDIVIGEAGTNLLAPATPSEEENANRPVRELLSSTI